MPGREPETYRDVAEAAWRWVLTQVRQDDGPWIPEKEETAPLPTRDGTHSGTGGLGLVLAEILLARPWTAEERELADAVTGRIRDALPARTDCTLFDGLVSDIGVLTALGAPGAEQAVSRLVALATPDGWPQTLAVPPRHLPDARVHDLALGTAGVLLGAVWARRHDVAGARELADLAAAVLLAESRRAAGDPGWCFVPQRFRTDGTATLMPNLSHGVAGVAAAMAVAGAELERADLVAAAVEGAEQLLALADTSGDSLLVPRYLPVGVNGEEEFTHTWCHGGAGTSLLFLALDRADVETVAGRSPLDWHRRSLRGVRTSGLPERLRPGFWDNDGRCCGTAGVGEVFLDSWLRAGDPDDLGFALHLADTVVDRAVRDGEHACWRFLEHKAEEPLLPPRVGWMQGAAGIAAFLFRAARVVEHGPAAEPVARMDTWWALPARPVSGGG